MDGPPKNQRIADLAAPDFAAAAAGNPVILLPLGSQEDHGPHLPMGDFQLADHLATEIATRATAAGTPTFAAPTLPFGAADHFGGSPGGMALSPASFAAALRDLLEGFRRNGLTRIVILNGHGGNVPIIHAQTLAMRLAHGQIIPSFYLWKVARALMARHTPGPFAHGAEPLLSLTRALRPSFTASPAPPAPQDPTILGLPITDFGTADFEGLPIDMPVEFTELPHDAVNASRPNPSLGAAIAEELIETAVRFVIHYGAR